MYTVAVAASMTVGTKPFFAAWEGKEWKGSPQRRAQSVPYLGLIGTWEAWCGSRVPVVGGCSAVVRDFKMVCVPRRGQLSPGGYVSSNNRSVACRITHLACCKQVQFT